MSVGSYFVFIGYMFCSLIICFLYYLPERPRVLIIGRSSGLIWLSHLRFVRIWVPRSSISSSSSDWCGLFLCLWSLFFQLIWVSFVHIESIWITEKGRSQEDDEVGGVGRRNASGGKQNSVGGHNSGTDFCQFSHFLTAGACTTSVEFHQTLGRSPAAMLGLRWEGEGHKMCPRI